jgi:hypothetical protein
MIVKSGVLPLLQAFKQSSVELHFDVLSSETLSHFLKGVKTQQRNLFNKPEKKKKQKRR